jgi:hypothetical protein
MLGSLYLFIEGVSTVAPNQVGTNFLTSRFLPNIFGICISGVQLLVSWDLMLSAVNILNLVLARHFRASIEIAS